MMLLNRCLLVISLILSIHHVSSSPSDIIQLRDHFIANLIEENRGVYSLQLTDDVERDIQQKIEGFLDIISEPPQRVRRDTNDLLLNEKSESNSSFYCTNSDHHVNHVAQWKPKISIFMFDD
jgi:hypothetical protein